VTKFKYLETKATYKKCTHE